MYEFYNNKVRFEQPLYITDTVSTSVQWNYLIRLLSPNNASGYQTGIKIGHNEGAGDAANLIYNWTATNSANIIWELIMTLMVLNISSIVIIIIVMFHILLIAV